MGDLLAADFRNKKYLGKVSAPIETPLDTGLSIIAEAMATDGSGIDGLAWPGMDEVGALWKAPEKDPA